jgi:hypothetical protein
MEKARGPAPAPVELLVEIPERHENRADTPPEEPALPPGERPGDIMLAGHEEPDDPPIWSRASIRHNLPPLDVDAALARK